jgi:hypothetical protein
MIANYINPRIGDIHLRGLRVEHVDQLDHDLLTSGSRTGGELASKTVYDVHVVIRSSLADAVRRSLIGSNVALMATDQGCLRTTRSRPPRLHDGHIPTPHPRHERDRGARLRQHDRHRTTRRCPIDVYRIAATNPQVTGRRRAEPVDDPVDDPQSRKRETPGNPMFPGISVSGGGTI